MKILVTSDNHGKFSTLKKLKEVYKDYDLFLHCGDCETSKEQLYDFLSVAGNNDYLLDLPDERIVNVDGIKLLLTHGHRYYGRGKLIEKAKKLRCKIVCFGHSHSPLISEAEGVLLLNPGSLRNNRDGSSPSYMILEVVNGEVISVNILRYNDLET